MAESDPRVEELLARVTSLFIAHSLLTPDNNEVLLLNKMKGLVTNIKWSPKDATDLFDALLKRSESTTNDRSHLLSWMLQMLHCIEIHFITSSWKSQTGRTLIELVRDKTVTDGNLEKCLADDTEKQLDEILEEIRQQKLNQGDEKLLNDVRDIVSSVDKDLTSHNDGSQRSGLKKDLLRLCQAAAQTHFRPRLTQMVSWCIMALSKTGRLIQVGTGEGKSCIVAMFAAFRAMRGEKVDIMTSSTVLAERDLKDWKKFYEALKITVDCNTNKQDEATLKECYKCHVVYGTAEKFAGDWLTQRFEGIDIFGQRTFQCAIVDEVDSLMLDKGHHTVYISSDMPALQHLNPLLAFIWDTANQYRDSDRNSVLGAVEAKIIHVLRFTPCELSQDECSHYIYVPGFLSDLVKSKLKVWIGNAFKAQTMTMGHEYILEKHGVVPVDYSSTGVVENFMTLSDGLQQFLEMKHQTKLSDMTAITNYMSSVGLFLKYADQIFGISGTLGQQAETETLQKIYKCVKTCQIPSFRRRKLFEVEGVIADDEKKWIEKICDIVTAQTNPTPYRDQRAVLVICETINRAKVLHHALGDKVLNKKLYISNNMDNSEVFKDIHAGDVIVATNLAGRGADLQVSDEVKRAGGLFVVQTFLPENARVEAQAFGRTARQGSPGSAQLIVCSGHLPEPLKLLALIVQLVLKNLTDDIAVYQNLFVKHFRLYHKSHRDDKSVFLLSLSHILTETSDSGLKTLKDARDHFATARLTSFSECDIANIKKKEELFDQYLQIRDDLYKCSCNKPADSGLSTLNETWGMWLLTNFNEKDSIEVLKRRLEGDLCKAREKLRQRESPSSNLHHYTTFGNELREKGHPAESVKMYTKAIKEDHCWAAIAYYNRAFASLEIHQDRSCINQVLEDLLNALKSVEFYHTQIEVTHTYSTQGVKDPCRDSVRFNKHLRVRYEVLKSFKGNITEAIKKLERARDTGRDVKVHKKLTMFLIPPDHSFSLMLRLIRLKSVMDSRDPLKIHQLINDPAFDIFTELQCLVSLGLTQVYTLDIPFSLSGFFSKLFK